jgi:hypothetical protein
MPPAGFKATISAGKQPHTFAFDRAATGTGTSTVNKEYFLYHTNEVSNFANKE